MLILSPRSDFYFNDPATTQIYTLSLHDALPISNSMEYMVGSPVAVRINSSHVDARSQRKRDGASLSIQRGFSTRRGGRSEEHTSELQSPCNLVCRLLLEKKNN